MKNTNIWDRFAPIYKSFVTGSRSNKRAYNAMYYRIRKVIDKKRVLELATGPGLIAKKVAASSESMIATDFSVKMIQEARKGYNPPNLSYEQVDATDLPYSNACFDVVIISNALHIIPSSEDVLSEIKRVLKPGGVLIAPNFIHSSKNKRSEFLSRLLGLFGVDFAKYWSEREYRDFLISNGFKVVNSHVFDSMIPLMYTESVVRKDF